MSKFNIPVFRTPSKLESLSFTKDWLQNLYGVKFSDWNHELLKHSYPVHFYTFSKEELYAIIEHTPKSEEVQSIVENIMKDFDCPVFVKLLSRSPKDWLIDMETLKMNPINNAAELLNALGCSMRTFEDLVHLCKMNIENNIIIRPYIDIPPENEWRCFVKNNKVIGISQYHYQRKFDYSKEFITELPDRIINFINDIVVPNILVSDFVVDLVIEQDKVVILETNPYGLSDPCLYESYENLELEKAIFLIADSYE